MDPGLFDTNFEISLRQLEMILKQNKVWVFVFKNMIQNVWM